ncbi:hypothetical protein [Lysinibacillus odysseyi]|uniref:Uncharacterized protein n=1 Tax=Lysinibacillus odysseyi 34hs-1 = NBRC 100172 TaxID=1220589 RepID=A0A0A3IZQ9_9BACI|nr:hypothetical protein [Lysinibacillus odysseyi]KGR88388.1 hypothetical protein CD32_01620 [Lysinibacillus odysseyi 34hs-1 = NBRC 100172]
MHINLYISNVKPKNKYAYTLIIKGTYPVGHESKPFEIDYTGVDVLVKKGDYLKDQENIIKEKLANLIGKGPFENIEEIKETLLGERIGFEYKSKY